MQGACVLCDLEVLRACVEGPASNLDPQRCFHLHIKPSCSHIGCNQDRSRAIPARGYRAIGAPRRNLGLQVKKCNAIYCLQLVPNIMLQCHQTPTWCMGPTTPTAVFRVMDISI